MSSMFINDVSTQIDRRLARNLEYRTNPLHHFELLWRPCTVRILMVADSFLYFSNEDFGLSDLIEILKTETLSYVRFEITVAHRGTPTDARMGIGNPYVKASIRSFRFDNTDHFPSGAYDQVWLFAAQRSKLEGSNWTNRLTDGELRKVMEFMDDGGGVFATGDHEDLGAAMGGFLPRVRQMRRWFFPDPGPNGEGLAPPIEGPGRFDTNREGHDSGYQFNDQSDDIPQPIEPKEYTAHGVLAFKEVVFPHPVLCGPNGPIRVLPDHPHESQCTTAANHNASATLAGKTFTEFPAATDGGPKPLPDVIATSRVIGGHMTTGKSGATVGRTFGAIAAYDGHRAGVGRVVTDATWHHFINVNLTGEAGTSGNKGIGFLASPAGLAALAEIKAYFLNIAQWIAPATKIQCMRNWGFLYVVENHRLKEVFDPAIKLESARLIDLIVIGRHARDAIGKFASQCQSVRWTWDLVWEEIQLPYLDLGDPWRLRLEERRKEAENPQLRDPEPAEMLHLDWIGDATLGGAILSLREHMYPLTQDTLDVFDDVGEEQVRTGARVAMQRVVPFVRNSLTALADATPAGYEQR